MDTVLVTNFLQKLEKFSTENAVVTYHHFLLALSVIVVVSWYIWMKISSSSSSSPPGPRGLPFVGNLLSLNSELHSYFASLSQTYGPVLKLRLGSKMAIVVCSPSMAREVLKDHDIVFANRDVPIAGRVGTYGGSNIVSAQYGPEWRMLRKVCALKMLSNTSLDSVYSVRRKEVRKTVSYLYKRVGTPVGIAEQVFLTILNVITSMLWGGTVEGEERDKIAAEFRQAVSAMTALIGKPNVSDLFPVLARFDLQGMERDMIRLAGEFDKIFERIINQRLCINRENGEDTCTNRIGCRASKDFLQFLLELKDENDVKTPITMTHVKALLMDMVVGGTETSANTIEFAMAELMNNPKIMKKAQLELDTIIGKNNIVEEPDIHKLPYINAIMKETLRLHPALPLLVPHCASETSTIGGYNITKGSQIFVNVWAIQRDPLVWENPLDFDPDRFMNGKGDFSGSDFSYFPFGSGRRICAGIAMAERMVLYSLATLLHSFDWELAEDQKLDVEEKFGIVLKKKKPLCAVPTPRFSNPLFYQ